MTHLLSNAPCKISAGLPDHTYDVLIDHDVLHRVGDWSRSVIGGSSKKVTIVSNPRVFKLYGALVTASLEAAGFCVTTFLMADGERFKNLRSAERAIKTFSGSGLGRTDLVLALGGGVVGDLAGFAASIYLRGLPFVQVPTTLLSMIDSSVGGKTGVNTSFGKNLIGSFYQPKGVLIDASTLKTLQPREVRAGFCEVIKHAALSGRAEMRLIREFLHKYDLAALVGHFQDQTFVDDLTDLIARQVAYKASVVGGDPVEAVGRTDPHSRKILNFGHTLGHALEKATDYRVFKHGEAVGYGLNFAAELSKSLALCPEEDVELLNDVVHRVGNLPTLADIDPKEVLDAFSFDKKNLNGSLEMILIKGLGRPTIVAAPPRPILKKAIEKFFRRWA